MNSFEKFSDLPSKMLLQFLDENHISNSKHKNALIARNIFELKKISEFYGLYLTTGILLLASVFKNFRRPCLSSARISNFSSEISNFCYCVNMKIFFS